MLTPLGLLAGGSAWGEWSASQLADPAARQEMASASLRQAPPPVPPAGLERLATVWTAPFPDYAPPFLRSRALGYVLSAMFGAGLVAARDDRRLAPCSARAAGAPRAATR